MVCPSCGTLLQHRVSCGAPCASRLTMILVELATILVKSAARQPISGELVTRRSCVESGTFNFRVNTDVNMN